jgi:hypothetical protein
MTFSAEIGTDSSQLHPAVTLRRTAAAGKGVATQGRATLNK